MDLEKGNVYTFFQPNSVTAHKQKSHLDRFLLIPCFLLLSIWNFYVGHKIVIEWYTEPHNLLYKPSMYDWLVQ